MKSKRGFASMSPERQRAIASLGGKTAHATGHAHKFTPEKARAAVLIAHANGHTHKFSSEEARIAGIKGGQSCAAKRRAIAEAVAVRKADDPASQLSNPAAEFH